MAHSWRMKIGVTAIEALGVGIGFFKTSIPIPIATPTPMDSGLGYFRNSPSRALYVHIRHPVIYIKDNSSSSLSLCFFLFVDGCGNVENSEPWPTSSWLNPQKETGGRKRLRLELRARAEGRSSARGPGSSRTGPRFIRADRCKAERPGCGITQGGLP